MLDALTPRMSPRDGRFNLISNQIATFVAVVESRKSSQGLEGSQFLDVLEREAKVEQA
jgi:hypothetical protein